MELIEPTLINSPKTGSSYNTRAQYPQTFGPTKKQVGPARTGKTDRKHANLLPTPLHQFNGGAIYQ